MSLVSVSPRPDYLLQVALTDGRAGLFDVRPYLGYQAFAPLNQLENFMRLRNGGYFVEWDCGADLSADTIEAKMTPFTEVR
jgi:hypothetical protein